MEQELREKYAAVKRTIVMSSIAVLSFPGSEVPIRQQLNRIGYISNISYEKGIREFIGVVQRLQDAAADIMALLAGPFQDDNIARELEPILQQLTNLEHLGPVCNERKAAFFRDVDVLLFPTHQEAEGLVIFEALSQGIPVIALERGCISEVMGTEGGLVHSDKSTYVEIAFQQIVDWRNNPSTYQQASQNAYSRYLTYREKYNKNMVELLALMANYDQ
ncbi:MAG: glycosyltransferase [Candidatus Marinimicrobia bacterium]|nr:glycosyltransferase [Candidatus Neomarinimicrobiota bacterium]